ncbi:uncharacterized protein LOC110178785 [Drosophila serrata]|uniref:uncharacterized protein LOC110178785 n=1 Tax=Drosophila serrata TaxID=7274 RepID=UPI000A1D019F|nr:uncharacterized protein LOC110178785 [Drosophila serrata]
MPRWPNQSDTFTINTAHCGLRGNPICASVTNPEMRRSSRGPGSDSPTNAAGKPQIAGSKGHTRGDSNTKDQGPRFQGTVAVVHRTDESHQSGTHIDGLRLRVRHPANRHVKSRKNNDDRGTGPRCRQRTRRSRSRRRGGREEEVPKTASTYRSKFALTVHEQRDTP